MKDIVPYSQEEARRLGRTLVLCGCPSFGPAVGMDLLRVVEGIDKILKRTDLSAGIKEMLESLRARFTDVCAVGASMQGEVLSRAEEIIRGG